MESWKDVPCSPARPSVGRTPPEQDTPHKAGVIRDGRVIADGTGINVAAERHGTATLHGAQYL